jgi:hypothetical protein
MGLLTKLNENQISGGAQIHRSPPLAEPAVPIPQNHTPLKTIQECVKCYSQKFWFDKFGGGPHCVVCRPWPSPALVSRVVDRAEPEPSRDLPERDELSQADLAANRELSRAINLAERWNQWRAARGLPLQSTNVIAW